MSISECALGSLKGVHCSSVLNYARVYECFSQCYALVD